MNPHTAPSVTGSIRLWLRAEALLIFIAAIAFYAHSGAGWGRFAALFLVPDLSLLAYLVGPRAGATTYNLAHSSVGPLALAAAAQLGVIPAGALPLACIWLAHVGFDRTLGYGLKYPTAFGHTHLGAIGKDALAVRPATLQPAT